MTATAITKGTAMEPTDVTGMTTEELLSNLITSDYRGQAFKKACLEEILRRNGHDQHRRRVRRMWGAY